MPETVLPAIICLFSSEDLRQGSCFAGIDRRWTDRTDAGACAYVSYALGTDQPAARVASPLAAVALVRPSDLKEAGPTAQLRAWCEALGRELPTDVVAVDRAMELYAWIGKHAPAQMRNFRQDGEVKPNLPSWWRRRAEIFLATPPKAAAVPAADESNDALNLDDLRKFMAKKKAKP
jgi:hypothetical protein